MEIADDNRIYEGDGEDYIFKYNFINTPWDDRSTRSKIGMISLLVLIAAVIAACVVNNLVIHYRGFKPGQFSKNVENNCHLVNKEEYNYVVRIYSVATRTILCVGAVVGPSSVLANEVCVKSGPIRLHAGSSANPRCKKGFSIDATRTTQMQHDGVVAKNLIILRTHESLAACSSVIGIGLTLDWASPAYVIGRPLVANERLLTKQPARLLGKGNCSMTGSVVQRLDQRAVICVRGVGRCPVRAGDLLLQHSRLFGVASTSVHRSEAHSTLYFADLSYVYPKLADRLNFVDINPKTKREINQLGINMSGEIRLFYSKLGQTSPEYEP